MLSGVSGCHAYVLVSMPLRAGSRDTLKHNQVNCGNTYMRIVPALILSFLLSTSSFASVADPQLKTDHPWYPGELSCSTFERLFATQAALYKRVTGRDVSTDEDKALASWYWRNLHFAHGEEGRCDFGHPRRIGRLRRPVSLHKAPPIPATAVHRPAAPRFGWSAVESSS